MGDFRSPTTQLLVPFPENMKLFIQVTLYIFFIIVIFVLISSKTPVFGLRSYVVLTGSMQPAIPAGSVIVVEKQSAYHSGDIITFKNTSMEVTHRIISIKHSGNSAVYETRGDANQSPDKVPVYERAIAGKVILHTPYIGTLIIFLKTFSGLTFFIIVPGVVFILIELWAIKTEIQKNYEN